MSSSGAQSNHINHVQTQMQYASIVAVICVIGYLIAGLCKNWLITLVLCSAMLIGVLLCLKKFSADKADAEEADKETAAV